MADYSTIKGFNVETLSSDPYASVAASGTWASGTTMNTARYYCAGTATAKDSALIAGGDVQATEQYNGTTWTEKNDMNAPAAIEYARMPVGTATAALMAGGGSPYSPTVEQWDGTNWTEVNDINTGRAFGSNSPIGTVTAGLIAGGLPGTQTVSEEWNGTCWAEGNDLNTGRGYLSGLGTQTAALSVGGMPGGEGETELYNGTCWSEQNDLNTGRGAATAGGTTTNALFYAGSHPAPTRSALTEAYDGTTWTEVSDLATARNRGGGGGTGASAIMAAGHAGPADTGATEEWSTLSSLSLAQEGQVWYNSSSGALKGYKATVGTGAWASGGALNTARSMMGGTGSQTAALAFFGAAPGDPSGAVLVSEEYNGTAWTNSTSGSSRRYNGGSIGQTSTDAGYAGGYGAPPPPLGKTFTEVWNGSSWTEKGDLNSGRQGFFGGAGTTTAGLVAGSGPADGATETFDGTSWTETANLVTARQYAPVTGATQDDAMCVGGYGVPAASPYSNGPGSRIGITETWDGTSWTHVSGTLNLGRISAALSGTTTAAIIAGGSTGDPAPPTTTTATAETWNGSSWTTVASLGAAEEEMGSSRTGGNTTALSFGGNPGGSISATEEWTVPATTFGIKTFTSS